MNNQEKIIWCFDVAKKGAVSWSVLYNVPKKIFTTSWSTINELREVTNAIIILTKLKYPKHKYYVYSYENTYFNHKTTRALGLIVGQIKEWFFNHNIKINFEYINETRAFKTTFPNIKFPLLREKKKIMAVEYFQKETGSKINNDDVAEAYILMRYILKNDERM